MRVTTELESRKVSLLKLARAVIRLRHSIAADEEIRRVLPELERRIDLAMQTGNAFSVDAAELLRELEADEAHA
jgi:hypothetical protein